MIDLLKRSERAVNSHLKDVTKNLRNKPKATTLYAESISVLRQDLRKAIMHWTEKDIIARLNNMGYKVIEIAPPIPTKIKWEVVHEDYDGPEDDRCFHCEKLSDALSQIEDLEE